jgi:Protein of unknown function (DUF992)
MAYYFMWYTGRPAKEVYLVYIAGPRAVLLQAPSVFDGTPAGGITNMLKTAALVASLALALFEAREFTRKPRLQSGRSPVWGAKALVSFTATGDRRVETYAATVTKIDVDPGVTGQTTMIWTALAASQPRRGGALAGI